MTATRSALLSLPLFALPFLGAPADASALRWEPAAQGAAIVLPVPARAAGLVGGTLSCAEGRWALRLRSERAASNDLARITVGDEVLTAAATAVAGTVEIALPSAALRLFKDGTEVAIKLGEEGPGARFPLAGSRAAIETAAPLCSPPALPGHEAVRLAPEGVAVDEARQAAAGEAALFREATMREPALAAGFVSADAGKALLFASLCGSNRYYGETGCKVRGFARETEGGGWKPVFESEGMRLFRDPRTAHDGWPNLVTVAEGGTAEQLRWTWRDGAYEVGEAAAVAEDALSVIDDLRTGTTAP